MGIHLHLIISRATSSTYLAVAQDTFCRSRITKENKLYYRWKLTIYSPYIGNNILHVTNQDLTLPYLTLPYLTLPYLWKL